MTLQTDTLTPPKYDGPIFDADTHIQEKDWTHFERYLPKKYWKEWLPQARSEEGEAGVFIGQDRIRNLEQVPGLVPPPGRLKEWLAAIASGDVEDQRIEPTPDMYRLQARVQKLDEFGVEGSILFIGIFVASFGLLWEKAERDGAEGANAVLHAYNDYLATEWSFNHDDKLYATGCLSLWDLDWALKEADWLIERGCRVVVMPMGPANGRAPADPHYDPLWQKLNDAGVVLTFHVSEANFMHPIIRLWGEEPMTPRRVGQTAWQWMFAYSEVPVMMTMASFIYWNFFERFPNMKIVSVENGSEWLPRFLYKLDKMRGMARSGYWPMGQLKERPSTIFKRHCFVVAYPEDHVAKIVEEIGSADCLLMGSDYPHSEGVPTPMDFVAEACAGLTDGQIRQIMYENGRRLLPKLKAD